MFVFLAHLSKNYKYWNQYIIFYLKKVFIGIILFEMQYLNDINPTETLDYKIFQKLSRLFKICHCLAIHNCPFTDYDEHEQMCKLDATRGKEGNVLFNDAFNTFYLRLYGIRHMV